MAARLNAEERQAVRDLRTRERRQRFYIAQMNAAKTGAERLSVACNFLRAVCGGLPDEDVHTAATAVVTLAEERNKP